MDIKKEVIKNKIIQISNSLDSTDLKSWEVANLTIDIVFVIESVMKGLLYKKNKLSVYKVSGKEEANDIATAVNGKNVESLHTVDLFRALDLFRYVFPNNKLNKITSGIKLLVPIRNYLVHGVTAIPFNKKETLDIIRSVFGHLLPNAEKLYGKLGVAKSTIKENVLSTKDIDDIFVRNVKNKIKNTQRNQFLFGTSSITAAGEIFSSSVYNSSPLALETNYKDINFFNLGKVLCPRCKSVSLNIPTQNMFTVQTSDLYQCSKCNLELTADEYEVAKNIQD